MSGWPRYPVVYEINTRVWLRELSAAAGPPLTLDGVADATLDELAALGFDAVWLMGVWTTGPEAVAEARRSAALLAECRRLLPDLVEDDVVGSPYAVSRYEVSPALGGPAALAALRERLAERGLRLLLDFVPNHTARDHWLVRDCPEAYVQGTDEDLAREPGAFFRASGGAVIPHGRDPHFPPWTDTAQLDVYGVAGRRALLRELAAVAAQCDGVRGDMAMLLLPDVAARMWGDRAVEPRVAESFWREAIGSTLARRPGFLFVAEAYWDTEWRLQHEGFHFTYDKRLYDRLRAGHHTGARDHLRGGREFQDRCARFTENHDEERAAAAFGPLGLRSAAAATFLTPGLKLLHEGQLEGRRLRVPVQLARRPVERPDASALEFHRRLLALMRRPQVREGEFGLLEVGPAAGAAASDPLLAFGWTRGGALGMVVVVNLGPERAAGSIRLAGLAPSGPYVLHDHWDGTDYVREAAELAGPGLYVELGPHRAHLFEMRGPAWTSR